MLIHFLQINIPHIYIYDVINTQQKHYFYDYL